MLTLEKSAINRSAPFIDQFYLYMYERQSIYYKRFVLKEPKPWTADETLQRYSFTNVHRQLDRVTIFYKQNILDDVTYGEDDWFDYLLWKTYIFRMFNRPETWLAIADPFNIESIRAGARKIKEAGQPPFTGAFYVCAYANVLPGRDKIDKVCHMFAETKHNLFSKGGVEFLKYAPDADAFHKELQKQLVGFGAFNAYEVYCDLTYHPRFWFKDNDFTNPGPGAKKGLQLIYPDAPQNYKNQQKLIRQLLDEAPAHFARLGLDFDAVNTVPLGLRSIEHSLCELFKLVRGRCKVGFNGV